VHIEHLCPDLRGANPDRTWRTTATHKRVRCLMFLQCFRLARRKFGTIRIRRSLR
jgi:hypothetical protein